MDTLSLRLAAGGGSLDGIASSALVSAGFTLLQRCPPLVAALGRARSGILLPPSPQWLVALAASEGRGAVLLDPNLGTDALRGFIAAERVGAVLTLGSLAWRVPAGIPVVTLDEAPRHARFVDPSGAARTIDLGTHFGLHVEGATDVAGRDEECLVTIESSEPGDRAGRTDRRASHTHAALIAAAEEVARIRLLDAGSTVRAAWDWTRPAPLTGTLLAPLIAGAAVQTASFPAR